MPAEGSIRVFESRGFSLWRATGSSFHIGCGVWNILGQLLLAVTFDPGGPGKLYFRKASAAMYIGDDKPVSGSGNFREA